MSFEELKSEIDVMPRGEQDRLAAYLVHLRHRRDTLYAEESRRKLDDKDPANWSTLDELKETWKD